MDIRDARPHDHDQVRRLCADIWPERDVEYIPRVYPEWLRGEGKRTIVATEDDRVVGIVQGVMLSRTEGWYQGLRVHPDYRGDGVAARLMGSLDTWADDMGAHIVRTLVYSWNGPGMGIARSCGFRPVTSFRLARPRPVEASRPPGVDYDPDRAWRVWEESAAKRVSDGLALDRTHPWALVTCTREAMRDGDAFVVSDGDGMAYRGRRVRGEATQELEYAATAWTDVDAAEALFQAIGSDAAKAGADTVRVPVPESPRFVSDIAACRVPFDAEPHFVFAREPGRTPIRH